MPAQHIVIDLAIPADEYIRVYQGSAQFVHCTAIDGRTVRFPAGILQKMIDRNGVYGRFAITIDVNGKFQSIERLS